MCKNDRKLSSLHCRCPPAQLPLLLLSSWLLTVAGCPLLGGEYVPRGSHHGPVCTLMYSLQCCSSACCPPFTRLKSWYIWVRSGTLFSSSRCSSPSGVHKIGHSRKAAARVTAGQSDHTVRTWLADVSMYLLQRHVCLMKCPRWPLLASLTFRSALECIIDFSFH